MSREEALSALRECQKYGDKELAHIEADQILCTLLTQEGFNDVVDEFTKLDKWYA